MKLFIVMVLVLFSLSADAQVGNLFSGAQAVVHDCLLINATDCLLINVTDALLIR